LRIVFGACWSASYRHPVRSSSLARHRRCVPRGHGSCIDAVLCSAFHGQCGTGQGGRRCKPIIARFWYAPPASTETVVYVDGFIVLCLLQSLPLTSRNTVWRLRSQRQQGCHPNSWQTAGGGFLKKPLGQAVFQSHLMVWKLDLAYPRLSGRTCTRHNRHCWLLPPGKSRISR
jgi:hypothetical protein